MLRPTPQMALCTVFVICFSGSTTQSYELVIAPKPQVAKDTCQSYQIAFALGMTGNDNFSVATTKQLREQEQRIRNTLTEVAANAPAPRTNDTRNHVNWQKAVKSVTNGEFRLCEAFFPELESFYHHIYAKTGNRSVNVSGAVLAAFTAKTPVFTSVSRVGPHTYGSGHIVAIFGEDVPLNPASSKLYPLAILNSAVKVSNQQTNMCSLTAGDSQYRAEVYLTDNYALSSFGNLGYSLMWLEKAGGSCLVAR